MSKLIVGLGNPGSQYTWTRHNLGFLVLEALCSRHQVSLSNSVSKQGLVAKIVIESVPCSLLLPMTYMNHSGFSVKKAADRAGIAPENILVICDDWSISFHKMRIRPSGSAGGHNGLKSVIQELGTNQFSRLRMGIKPITAPELAMVNRVDFVLGSFTPVEKKVLPDFINHALDCVTSWVTEGAQAAMNKFN